MRVFVLQQLNLEETMNQIAKEKNVFEQYLENSLPGVIDFLLEVILAVVFLLVGLRVVNWIVHLLRKSLEKANIEAGVNSFVASVCKYVLYFILILMILSNFGVTASSVVAVLGSAGLTVGLALQGSLSNFAGGVLILLLKPFVVGDYIIVSSETEAGTVAEISIFYTKLLTTDNRAILIPNGTLSNTSITNVTAMQNRRLDLFFDIAYDSDIQKVKAILTEVVMEDEARLLEEDMNIFVSELAASSIIMGIRIWVKKEDYWTAKWRITENVKYAFDKYDIQIPFPQVDVNLKK